VQEAHTNLFAGAALTLDEDGDIGLRNPLQLVSDRLHCGSFPENDIQRREVERSSGFGVVDQGHFFLSAFRRNPQSLQYASHCTLSTNHKMQKQKTADILGPKERISILSDLGAGLKLQFCVKIQGHELSTTKVSCRKNIPFFWF
jgi:hypothetical protein